MISYILPLFVITLFAVFAIFQIRQSKEEMKNSRRAQWLSTLRMLFAVALMCGLVIIAVAMSVNYAVYK